MTDCASVGSLALCGYSRKLLCTVACGQRTGRWRERKHAPPSIHRPHGSARHLQVKQNDVGLKPTDERDGLFVGGGLAYDLHVPGEGEHLGHTAPEQFVVIAERYPYLIGGVQQAMSPASGVRLFVETPGVG